MTEFYWDSFDCEVQCEEVYDEYDSIDNADLSF